MTQDNPYNVYNDFFFEYATHLANKNKIGLLTNDRHNMLYNKLCEWNRV